MKTISFIKKHPWLLSKCLFLTVFISNFLVNCLSKSVELMLVLKGKNPNYVPPTIKEPTYDDIFKYYPAKYPKQLQVWSPSWIRSSLTNMKDHPVIKSRLKIASDDADDAAAAAEKKEKWKTRLASIKKTDEVILIVEESECLKDTTVLPCDGYSLLQTTLDTSEVK